MNVWGRIYHRRSLLSEINIIQKHEIDICIIKMRPINVDFVTHNTIQASMPRPHTKNEDFW